MPPVPSHCPACHESLNVSRLGCPSCLTQVDGTFAIPPLMRLAPDDLDFVTRFILASGSLKDLAAEYRVSYPTIRNRLNGIIERLAREGSPTPSGDERLRILDELAKGELSVAAAERRLKALS